jgi:hypothetical protein
MAGGRHGPASNFSVRPLCVAMATLATIVTLLLCANLLVFSATAVAQTSYGSLTPGSSTRADVERVLGYPIGQVTGSVLTYPAQVGLGPIEVEAVDWLLTGEIIGAA